MSPEVSGDDEYDDEGGGCPVNQSINQTNSIDGRVYFFRHKNCFCRTCPLYAGENLKTHKMFSVHTTLEKFELRTEAFILDLCFRKTHSGKSRDYRDVIAFDSVKSSVVTIFLQSRHFQLNSSSMKSVFEKLCFRSVIVWTVGLTVEIKLRCPIYLASCWHGFDIV